MPTLSRIDQINLSYSRQIDRAVTDFGDHPGITPLKLLKWMANFADEDLELAVKILRQVKYYSTSNIWAMTRELARVAKMSFASFGIDWSKVIFVPIGGPYSGSATIARVLRETGEVAEANIRYMADVDRMSRTRIGALFFIDDFSGTGSTLRNWWRGVAEPIVLPKEAPYAVGLLILNFTARKMIERIADRILCVEELSEHDNVLSHTSPHFTSTEKTSIRGYCHRTGVSSDYRTGFGSCGILLAFKHGCPDNSLPVLWGESNEWEPLFRRRAV